MSKRRVVLLPGDGIGPEVVGAARRVVYAVGQGSVAVRCVTLGESVR